MKTILLTLLSLFVTFRLAGAVPVASNTGGLFFNTFVPGQSFTVVAPGPVNQIIFNFFSDAGATTPAAYGTGFLLSTEFLGLPAALSNATPGFLGMATAAGGFYTFDPALTLFPGIQYFLYANAAGQLSGEETGTYLGGDLYFTFGPDAFQLPDDNDMNFFVEGTPVAAGVPEIDGRYSAVPLAALLCLLAVSQRRAWGARP